MPTRLTAAFPVLASPAATLPVARVPDAVAIGRAVDLVLPGVARGELRAAVLVVFGTFLHGYEAGSQAPAPAGFRR